ncbi:Na(+) H(+) antiporter subunit E [Pseudomonas chlororaphis subsp. aureofaciens]|nr:Na(+) H(+) antiporter subunit E [Pseudomonas chlororaphis subsp. aureofaciens]
MKRLFPAPWLSLALWLLWLVLNLSVSPGNLLLGALLGFCAPLMMRPLRPLPIRIRRPATILRLFLLVGRDVLLSNLAVAWGVLNAGRRPPRSRFVKIPWTCATPTAWPRSRPSPRWCRARCGPSCPWTAASCCCMCSTWTTKRLSSSTSRRPTSVR